MRPRIAVGGFAQESNSFSPVPGSWAHFGPGQVFRGQEMIQCLGRTRTELGGAFDLAQGWEVELVPLLAARASSSAGPMQNDVFEGIRDELLEWLDRAGPVQGVLLVLHGAMVVEGYEDGTGEVLRAVRAAVGPQIPVVGTLDLHANVTQLMVEQATALVGFHTAPHVDLYETGQRGMRLLIQTVVGHVSPRMGLARLPMILPGEAARTTDGPLAEVMSQAHALMERPEVLDVSVFSVQPWLDVHDVGCSVLVVTDGDGEVADRYADQLAQAFWERRHRFQVDLTPTDEALSRALEGERRPFVLADSADAPTSGAPGDSTVLLGSLLKLEPSADCYLNIVDPEAVSEIVEAGVGGQVTVQVGATAVPWLYHPVEVSGKVRLISDGTFVQKGPGFRGAAVYRGRTVVLQIGRIYLVVSERAARQWEPEFYRSVGLEPRDAQIVMVKSPAAFRASYEPIAAEILIVDAPGVCSPDLRSLPFRHVRRPLYPLDDFLDWRMPQAEGGSEK